MVRARTMWGGLGVGGHWAPILSPVPWQGFIFFCDGWRGGMLGVPNIFSLGSYYGNAL